MYGYVADANAAPGVAVGADVAAVVGEGDGVTASVGVGEVGGGEGSVGEKLGLAEVPPHPATAASSVPVSPIAIIHRTDEIGARPPFALRTTA